MACVEALERWVSCLLVFLTLHPGVRRAFRRRPSSSRSKHREPFTLSHVVAVHRLRSPLRLLLVTSHDAMEDSNTVKPDPLVPIDTDKIPIIWDGNHATIATMESRRYGFVEFLLTHAAQNVTL